MIYLTKMLVFLQQFVCTKLKQVIINIDMSSGFLFIGVSGISNCMGLLITLVEENRNRLCHIK